MNESAIWAIVGVIVGFLGNWFLQSKKQAHEKKMYMLQNMSAEVVKSILTEMLNHRNYVDRSFSALKRAIGGYSDDQIRQLLHEVGAKKTSRDDQEWWYLISRQDERIKNIEKNS